MKKHVCVNEQDHPGKRKGAWSFDVDLTLEQYWKKSSFKYMQVHITEAYLSAVVSIVPKADPEAKCSYKGFIWRVQGAPLRGGQVTRIRHQPPEGTL